MPSTSSLLSTLKNDFSGITFVKSESFRWSPKEQAIYYGDDDPVSLLHEVAHAALDHKEYDLDIELLTLEVEAWDYALSHLSGRYDIEIGQEQVETMLNTYRDWLHDRSLCPSCQATGVQIIRYQYSCLACTTTWRVNEARSCALRRYKTK